MDKYSSCCGAGVYEDMLICKECKEHCSVEKLEDEETEADKLKENVDLDVNRELNPAN